MDEQRDRGTVPLPPSVPVAPPDTQRSDIAAPVSGAPVSTSAPVGEGTLAPTAVPAAPAVAQGLVTPAAVAAVGGSPSEGGGDVSGVAGDQPARAANGGAQAGGDDGVDGANGNTDARSSGKGGAGKGDGAGGNGTKGSANGGGKKAFDISDMFIPGVVLLGIVLLFWRGGPIFDRLSEPAGARGMITAVISLATIGLAFMLVYQAFADVTDEKFRRAREIYAGFLGVFGTIVGFYFGSITTGAPKLNLAPVQVTATAAIAHVTGGTPPYRWTLTAKGKDVDGNDLPAKANGVSDDGWIRYSFSKPASAADISIDVKDGQSTVTSASGTFPSQADWTADAATAPGRSPRPGAAGSVASSANSAPSSASASAGTR